MQRKLLGIINADFDATGQLLIIYSACAKFLRKKMGIQCSNAAVFTDFMIACHSIRTDVMYNILIESGIPIKLVRLIKMCLNIAEFG
jgi:hypothetical protein